MTIPTQAVDLTRTANPTTADAQLMVQLAQLGTSMQIGRGQALLRKHHKEGGLSYADFEATYPAGHEDGIAIVNVLNWYETIGTLVKQGLLDRGLVLDWLWVSGSWKMCEALALGMRKETGSPEMYENFESLAAAQT
jgi:hypothetical protein